MRDYLIAMLAFPILFIVWVAVQRIHQHFAHKHPEFGAPPDEGGGCGSSCMCGSSGSCKNRNSHD